MRLTVLFRGREENLTRRGELLGLVAITIIGGALRFLPVLLHEYPIGAGGLFAQFIDTIEKCFPCQPATIPYYTPNGLPFAYPPLSFQLAAIIKVSTGVQTTTLLKWLSPLLSTIAIPIFSMFLRESLPGSRERIMALGIFSFSPTIYHYQVSASGLPRAFSLIWLGIGMYDALKLAKTGHIKWVVGVAITFALTLSSHPAAGFVFVLAVLGVYLGIDRSSLGLLRFVAGGFIGFVIAGIYWVPVVLTHGTAPFLSAFTSPNPTTPKLGRTILNLMSLNISDPAMPIVKIWTAFAVIGIIYTFCGREWLSLALFSTLTVAHQQYLFIPVSILATIAVTRVMIPSLVHIAKANWNTAVPQQLIGTLIIISLLTYGLGSGLWFSYRGHGDLRPWVDEDELTIMREIPTVTASNARFLGISNETEWLGYYAQRTVVNAMWGGEWDLAESTHDLYYRLSHCTTAECVLNVARDADADYLFIPLRPSRGTPAQIRLLINELDSAHGFREILGNQGAIVYQIQESVK